MRLNSKTVIFEAGQSVSVKIPAINHGGTELKRIPCVVIDLIHDKYRIVCKYGILNDLYGANDLEKYEGLIDFEFKKINNKVSLTTAAIAASNGRRTKALNEIEVSCACKGKCDDKRCKCFKNDIKCNSHCHGKIEGTHKCTNKD